MITRYEFMQGDKPARLNNGPWVTFEDHEKELKEWKQRVLEYAKNYGAEVEELEQKLAVACEALERLEQVKFCDWSVFDIIRSALKKIRGEA